MPSVHAKRPANPTALSIQATLAPKLSTTEVVLLKALLLALPAKNPSSSLPGDLSPNHDIVRPSPSLLGVPCSGKDGYAVVLCDSQLSGLATLISSGNASTARSELNTNCSARSSGAALTGQKQLEQGALPMRVGFCCDARCVTSFVALALKELCRERAAVSAWPAFLRHVNTTSSSAASRETEQRAVVGRPIQSCTIWLVNHTGTDSPTVSCTYVCKVRQRV